MHEFIIIIIIIIALSQYSSTYWKKLNFCNNLSWVFCFYATDPQKVSISFLHLLEDQPLGRLPSMGVQSVCYLGCPFVLKVSHDVSDPSPFAGFNEVHDAMNLSYAS